jgi:flagellum-specific peptidoglycan hydrolase FlgJ
VKEVVCSIIGTKFAIIVKKWLSMRRFLCIILLLSISGIQISSTFSVKEQLIEQFAALAVSEMEEYGIPASIKIAQAIVETNWGKSTLAEKANNYFGIKCKETWTGPTFFHPDDDRDKKGRIVPSCFRSYNNIAESFRDHSEFLTHRTYYKSLFSLAPDDYIGWAHGLKKCGYATDPKYALKLIHIIEQYDLAQYDKVSP